MADPMTAPTWTLEELRELAASALKEWFEAGVKAGLNPMVMAGQLMQDVERMLGE